MTVNRRVLYGLAGAVLVSAVVFVHCQYRYPPTRFPNIIVLYTWAEPYSTIAGYTVSVAGFYLLGAGAIGGRLRSRHWVACLLAAQLLAATLVVGMAVCWEIYQPRRVGINCDP